VSIHFKYIRWKNLLSTGNEFTEIQLDRAQTTLIVGENGAGKSTFLEALTFSLFGKPFRKVNKPQLVNSMTRKNLVVEVEFSIGPNSYKIARGLKPNLFEIYQNGSLVDQSAESRDYQEVLEKQILKVNYKSFCQVVVLGSASYVPFMQLPAGQRREIIEDLLDLQVFTSMNALLKDRVYFNSERVRTTEIDKKLMAEKIKLVRKHSDERAESDRKLIEDREQAIESTQKQVDEALAKKESLLKDVEDLFAKMGDENAAVVSVRKINRLKQELELRVESLNKDVKFLVDNTTCPTCAQEIDPKFRESHVHEKQGRAQQINESMPDLTKKLADAQAVLDEAVNIRKSVNELKLKVSTLDSQVKTYRDYIARTQTEIDSIKNRVPVKSDDDLPSLEKKQSDLELQLRTLMDDAAVLNLAGLMLKDGGIKSKIVKQYVPIMNKFINSYLAKMDFFCEFYIDENFEEIIKSRYRDEFSYESFSEGEKLRIDLALLFTWRAVAKLRNSINTNLLILDEVLDSSLDQNGADEFLKLIKSMIDGNNTFIISHKTDQVSDHFSSIIKFTKHRNFSRIVE
jgi:DNA repair exonuclease SbcCD ATPase subunit